MRKDSMLDAIRPVPEDREVDDLLAFSAEATKHEHFDSEFLVEAMRSHPTWHAVSPSVDAVRDLEFQQSSIEQQQDRELLCPMLRVPSRDGLSLLVDRKIKSEAQKEIIEVLKVPENEHVMRIVCAEGADPNWTGHTGKASPRSLSHRGIPPCGHGVLIESAHHLPVAFLDTSDLYRPVEAAGYISIVNPSSASNGHAPETYAYALRDPANGIVHLRYKQHRGPVIMSVRSDGSFGSATIASPDGKLIASMQEHQNGEAAWLNVARDMDAALALSALIAAIKLNRTAVIR